MEKGITSENGTISILGTGDYGRAMASRLIQAEYSVVMGSRNPQARDPAARNAKLAQVKVVSIPDAIRASDIIIVAWKPSAYPSLMEHAHLMEGKTLVDVNNPEKQLPAGTPSGAQALAETFPACRVVKAFNTISAYALEFDYVGESKAVYICSDSAPAKEAVSQLASDLSFRPVNGGGLKNAARFEQASLLLFPGWGWPTVVMATVFGWWCFYMIFYNMYLSAYPYAWERLPTNVFNKMFGSTSISLLALVYMPGCIAGFIQLAKGTKHVAFSGSLDRWLKMRKQLGLFALLFALLHAIMSVVLISPGYFSWYYLFSENTVPLNRTSDTVLPISSRMDLEGELFVFFGVLAVAIMSLLGLSSLPSVSATFNWREWTFVQSYMGFLCLVVAECHLLTKCIPYWRSEAAAEMVLQDPGFLSFLLPSLTLLMKLALLLPCVYCHLNKIRNGWERGVNYGAANDIEAGGVGRSGKIGIVSNGCSNGSTSGNQYNKLNGIGNGQIAGQM